MSSVQRLFADSNIVFSASLHSHSEFRLLWTIPGVEILTSRYVLDEVTRNLLTPQSRARLWSLIYQTHLVPDGDDVMLPEYIKLPAKDEPILRSAIAGKADLLITGDSNHFGPYFGVKVQGVEIISARAYKRLYPDLFRTEPGT